MAEALIQLNANWRVSDALRSPRVRFGCKALARLLPRRPPGGRRTVRHELPVLRESGAHSFLRQAALGGRAMGVRRHVWNDDSLEGPRAHDPEDRHELSRRKRRFDLPTRSGWTLSLKVLCFVSAATQVRAVLVSVASLAHALKLVGRAT